MNIKELKMRFPPDGLLTSGRCKHDVNFAPHLLSLEIEDHGFDLTKAEELNTMISEEDEPSSVLNGRLRPRKSTATIPNPLIKSYYKPENKVAQDKPKRNDIPSKASPNKQDDLTAKADSSLIAQLLCPYCDRKFTNKLSASKHARRIHLCTSKQDNFINCLYCNHSEAAPADIIGHMVDNHPKQYFACLECKSRFLSTADLEQHKRNVCEKQKQAYRSKLRQKTSPIPKKEQKKINAEDKNPGENKELKNEHEFNSVVFSCELKPSQVHEAVDIEDKITTNLILPSNISNTGLEKNAVIILDDIQWNRRIPPNFSFRNADADQILSRLGVVHRSPRVGESTRREWLKMIDDNSQKFEKCFDTNFYSRIASNVQENLARFLDGSFNFSPDPDKIIKTRKSKSSAIINTAEGFPILLPPEQYSRNRFDGYIPRAIAPKHKWKWDSTENEKHIIIDANFIKRDNHVDNCIITLVSSLDIWTQLRMRRKFEGIFYKAPTEKIEKQNIIGRQLKEILESREIPCSKSQIVAPTSRSTLVAAAAAAAPAAPAKNALDFASFLGLSARVSDSENSELPKPAVLSGEWVRPRCYVCCACGDQTRESRALTAHMAAHHTNAQVQHYEIVGESLLNADILKHLYVPPSQMSNRTRPLRGFRDCTKCKKSIALEDLHQHMLDCAGDTPTVRRKCRSRLFGVRKRRPRLPDNAIRKKIRKDLRTRNNQKSLLRARPRVRTEVGDAETIRKMLADLPAKRRRSAEEHTSQQLLPRRLGKQRNKTKIKRLASKDTKSRKVQLQKDIDEDDQPLKPKKKTEKTVPAKKRFSSRVLASKHKKDSLAAKEVPTLNEYQEDAPAGEESASQSHQKKYLRNSENSTPKLNVSVSENYNREGENHDRSDNNEKREPGDDLTAPDPTLLKHSINNITASDLTLQSQKLDLPQQTNTEESVTRKTNDVHLESQVESSIPGKPPLQINHKSSSEKKRQSLLNCIEKIKSQQKGETMFVPTSTMKKNRKASEPTHLSLLDPHPAVICRTRDESGVANNVIPDTIRGPQKHESYELYSRHERQLDLEAQRQPNETPVFSPIPYYPQMFSDSLLMPSGIQMRKSPTTPANLAQNDHNPTQMNQSHYRAWPRVDGQWNAMQNFDTIYARLLQPQLQQTISQRMPFPPNVLLQPENRYPVLYQSISMPGQYDSSDIHYEGRRDYIQGHNETTQFPNISSLSPQSWSRESSQTQLVNNNHTVRSILSSMSANEPAISTTTTQQTAQKRVSRSSETDSYGWNSGDGNIMSNFANMRRSSFETSANVYAPIASQGVRELPYNYNTLKGLNPQKDISSSKKYDSSSYTQDTHERTYDTVSAVCDAASKKAEHYHKIPSQTAAVKYHNYVSSMAVEDYSLPCSGNKIDDFHLKSHNDLVPKSLYSSNLNEKKNDGLFSAEHPHLSPSVPTETHSAKLTPSPNHSIIQKSIDTCDHNGDNIQNIRLVSDTSHSLATNSYDKHTLSSKVNYVQEITKEHTESGSTEEPLDLSGQNRQVICNDERAFGVTHTHLDLRAQNAQNSAQIDSVQDIGSAFEYNEDNEDFPLDLSFKNNSRSTHNKSSDTALKKQDIMPCMIEQNNISKHSPPSCKRSIVEYYKETNKINENKFSNKNAPNAFSGQSTYDKDKQHHNEVQFVSNDVGKSEIAKAFESQLNLQTGGFVVTTNRLDRVSEKLSPPCLNKTAVLPEHNTFQKESDPVYTTYVKNQMIESNFGAEQILSNNNTSSTTISSIDHYPEDANVAVKTPELLTEKQQNDFLDVISQTNPSEKEGEVKLLITDVTQNVEDTSAEVNTSTVCDALTNYSNNRLTVNTTSLPSSSILPKKRHSPSAGLNTQDAFLNMSLSKPFQKQQPPSTITSIHNSNHVRNAPDENAFDLNNKRFDKTVDLKDDDLNHSKAKTNNTPNSNVSLIEELIPKLMKSKNVNEKTASLRAVRFKAPLARKSISDDKHTKVYSQQLTCLDLSQKDLKTDQTPHFECDTRNVIVDTAQNAEYHANFSTSEIKTKTTTENVQIESETSMALFKQMKHYDMSKVAYNAVADKVETVTKNINPVKQMEQNNITIPCKDILPVDARENTEHHTFLVTSKSTIDVECDNISNIINTKNDTGNYIDSHVNATHQFLKSNEKSNTNTPLKPAITIIQENSTEKIVSITKLNEDEDSDDDISLALIVKQKQINKTSDHEIDANKNNIPKQTIKENLSGLSDKSNKAAINSELLAMNTMLKTANEDESLISAFNVDEARKINAYKTPILNSMVNIVDEDNPSIAALIVDETRKTNSHAIKSDSTADAFIENRTVKASYNNDVNEVNITQIEQDREIMSSTNIIEKGTTGNSSNNENTSENSLNEYNEQRHVPDISNEKNGETLVFQITNDLDYEANKPLWKSNIQSKSMHAKAQIDTVVQNNSNETYSENNEIQPYINKINSDHSTKSDKGNVSLVVQNTKSMDILNTEPAELHPLSGVAKQKQAKKSINSEKDLVADSSLSSDFKETNIKALRRSKRGKSMFSDDKDSINHDINHVNDQKKPVTIKQLIFSKLLRNENLQGEKNTNLLSSSAENVPDIKSAFAIETKMATKRKKSPIKAENKKKKSFDLKQDYECSDLHNLNCPENDTSDDNSSNADVSELAKVKSNDGSEAKIYNRDYNDKKTMNPDKTNTCVEIRTACYNRSIDSNQTSTFVPVKKPENYDPYDIDFDMDMAETSRPVVKRKGNKTFSANNTNKSSKITLRNEPDEIIRQESDLENRKLTITTPPTVTDSDSSVSDAPLQKYVEEKEKLQSEHLKLSNCNKFKKASKSCIDDEIASTSGKAHLTSGNDEQEESNADMNSTNNLKLDGKQKNIRRSNNTEQLRTANEIECLTVSDDTEQSITANEIESLDVYNEMEQEDKWMENFGFYSSRKPRLSNLLAAKKIAETFHMFRTFRAKDRQKKSSHIDNKKSTVGARTSKLTQDTNNANADRKSRTTFQSTIPQDTDGTDMIEEQNPANDDAQVDVITAQKDLDSEEKRDHEFYSELKKASTANANNKTSGFHHLRAEETSFHDNNNHDVSTRVGNDIEMTERPERIENREMSSSPEMPESPENLLKDKPLMYPEEEVNIYEDKYDIIKRRREATANAKQVPKVDKPRKSKIEKRQKKPDRKKYKKNIKKAIYQGSQVPTKAALKGFDGIKISIPTQDLNMPSNVSPPHHQQRQSRSKIREESFGKARANSGSSCKSNCDAFSQEVITPDIYEFKDDERPVTKGYRLTKINDKNTGSSTEQEEICKIATLDEKYYIKNNDHETEDAIIRKNKGKGKGKGKRTEKNNTNKEIHEKDKIKKKDMQIKEKEPDLSLIYESETKRIIDDYEQPVETIMEVDDGLSKENKNNMGTFHDNMEPFEDSDIEMQTAMPGTSGFVPDRNDESSYESDSSSRTPILSVLKGPYACTCLSEIDSDDSETERGCAHSLCRYSHLTAAKNAVMGKIFKSNAVRCNKSDESPEESPKPKPDLDRLFDSLLELNTDNNATETRINISPVPGPSSASTVHLMNNSLHNKEMSIVEVGFSSPNCHDSVKTTETVFKYASQASSFDINMSKGDDTDNFGEKIDKPINIKHNIKLVHKLIQTDVTKVLAKPAHDLRVERRKGKEPELLSNMHLKNCDWTSNDSLDEVQESSNNMLKTRGTQTKRSFPLSDIETSSCEGEFHATKIARKNRRANKRHKSHHKRNKVYQNEELDDPKDDSMTTASKQNSRSNIVLGEYETESIGNKRSNEKQTPYSGSDNEISTSHDNSADAYIMVPAEDSGVAVQRARRKCTVGKQNVLAEHWSSSESEAGSAPNRAKGKKNSVGKKISRTGKKDRANRRSRGGESDDGETGETRAPPGPKVRARAASAVASRDRDSGSDAERDMKQEQHGWIVGRSHKKLVTMLACCKSKPRLEVKEKEKKK